MSSTGSATEPAAPSAEALVGTTISQRYKVESLLGAGGMGAVYLVQHTHMRKRFALKMLHSETSKNPEIVARFEREAMAAANVDHPNVAVASDFGRAENGAFFLVLEYLEGKTLHHAMNAGPLGTQRVLHIARQIAGALERAHSLSIVHRDLKPENIMLVSRQGDADFVKVLDFGLAKVVAQSLPASDGKAGPALTKHGQIFGTPKYMAPEQCVSGPTDGRTDLYALGLIMYEALTGRHPFDGRNAISWIGHQLSTPVPAMRVRAPEVQVPDAVEAVIRRLTEKEPEQRYESATELLRVLAALSVEQPAALAASVPASVSAIPQVTSEGKSAEKIEQPLPPQGTLGVRLGAVLARLPAPVQKRPLLLLLPLLLLALILVLVMRTPAVPTPAVGGRSVTALSSVPAAQVNQAQLDAAISSGLPALLGLAKQYPGDPRVQRTVAHTYMAQKNGLEALRWLARVVAIDGSVIREGELLQAAMLAVNDRDAMAASISLLENELGARGVDVLYTLAVRPGPSRIKNSVQRSFTKADVRARASAAAAVAIELHAAQECTAKRALLPRAAQVGDRRALIHLKSLTQVHNCGPYGMIDCWACLRADTALRSAITTIEARTTPPAGH